MRLGMPARLGKTRGKDYLRAMDIINIAAKASFPAETEAARQSRLAREAIMIAEALASVAAGRLVCSEAVDAWIDSLDTDHELPVPYAGC
jgi:predicted transcriptional regulator